MDAHSNNVIEAIKGAFSQVRGPSDLAAFVADHQLAVPEPAAPGSTMVYTGVFHGIKITLEHNHLLDERHAQPTGSVVAMLLYSPDAKLPREFLLRYAEG